MFQNGRETILHTTQHMVVTYSCISSTFRAEDILIPTKRYPVLFSADLPKTEPYGIQILGYPLVFWRNKNKKVNCVLDSCPHRSAPLSVGRVINGTLECKYHGWKFEEEGKCSFIPSAPQASPPLSSHCSTFPCLEKYETIWVWIGDQRNEEERLRRFPDHLFELFDNPNYVRNTNFRDLDIDHGLMVPIPSN